MTTGLRLLLMFVTFAGLFALTWFFFGRDRQPQIEPPAPPAKVRPTAELLVGTWKVVEHDPPLPRGLVMTIEFTADGKHVTRMTHPHLGPLTPSTGVYELKGDVIESYTSASPYNEAQSGNAKIETITEDSLVLVGIAEKPTRTVFQRER